MWTRGKSRGQAPPPEELNKELAATKSELKQTRQELARAQSRSAALERELEAVTLESSVAYDGAVLPPRRLRFCRPAFQDDDYYLASARAEADRLTARFGLSPASRVLDVGCGQGRLAIGILDRLGKIAAYRGVDVDELSIRWCERHLGSQHDAFDFLHLDVGNARYNPGGESLGADFRFPFADGEFDLVYLYSVFSHMLTPGVRAYLKDFARVLAPGGGIFLTAFVEEGVPDVTENPESYRVEWKGPLHAVRYDKSFFEGLLSESGLRLGSFEYETEGNGQSALYVSHA